MFRVVIRNKTDPLQFKTIGEFDSIKEAKVGCRNVSKTLAARDFFEIDEDGWPILVTDPSLHRIVRGLHFVRIG